jgi:hypothetical protein
MASKLIKKMAAITSASRLELSVSKKATVATTVEVGSTGSDDKKFTDKQLTPGPTTPMPLNPTNSYNIVWSGAFVTKGSVTLKVQVLDTGGAVKGKKSVTVNGEAKDEFFRLVMIP